MEIPLFNRDGADLQLTSEDNHTWKLQVDKEHQWVLENIRMGYGDDGDIYFIDPAGGPYLTKGTELEENLKINHFSLEEGHIVIHT